MPVANTDPAGVLRDRPLYDVLSTDKKRVAYFYDSDIGNYAYVTGHPMKPHRIRLCHSLVMNYSIFNFLEIYRAKPATPQEMTQFHTDEYIEFLQKVTPDNMDNFQREQGKYNVGDDCPVFDGLFEFCGISAGGSMEGAARLNRQKCDIAINWAGGLHHAKKSEASGFCYVNDIVLAILELLRYKKRLLYIDIDVHHGDGVEEAFYTTDRVMTVSFHKYGEYFPGTGELRDIGIGLGKNYSVNFPLRDGIDDLSYESIFEPVIEAVMTYYQPEAVVLQCGGDSLSGDRLGCFNLSMRGHANCVNFVRSFGLPTLVLGGGGYTMRNVSRTWAYETGRLVGVEMDTVLPYNEYYEYYGPDYELNVRPSNMENANNREYLEKIMGTVVDHLKKTAHVPSVQMQDVPRQGLGKSDDQEDEEDDLDEDEHPDARHTQRRSDKHVRRGDEFEDSDDEDMDDLMYRGKRAGIMDYRNPNATDADFDVGMKDAGGDRNGAEPLASGAITLTQEEEDALMEDEEAPATNGEHKAAAAVEPETEPEPKPAATATAGAAAAHDADGDVDMNDVDADPEEASVPVPVAKVEEVNEEDDAAAAAAAAATAATTVEPAEKPSSAPDAADDEKLDAQASSSAVVHKIKTEDDAPHEYDAGKASAADDAATTSSTTKSGETSSTTKTGDMSSTTKSGDEAEVAKAP